MKTADPGYSPPQPASQPPESSSAVHLWWILLGSVLGVHFCWELLDSSPPVWDMAYHQLKGWHYLHAWQDGSIFREFATLSSYYPPLYYLQEALILGLFPSTQFLALFSNIPGLLLLAFGTYGIAARLGDPVAAAVAGVLPLLFPLVAWTSRLSLLDVSLAGWVAAAGYLLLRSEYLQIKGWSLLLGLALGAGMLTKWTFAIFLTPPLLYAIVHSPSRRVSTLNLLDAVLLAIPPVFWWYLPNLNSLIERFDLTAQAASSEGDPGLGSLLAWFYYPRCLFSYYLYLPLASCFLWGLVRSLRNPTRCKPIVRFCWWWLLGSLLLLTLLQAKDPRYVMPLVAPMAVLLVASLKEFRTGHVAILVLAFLQFLTVTFSMPFAPVKLALWDLENDTDYRSMRQEWVFYQTQYFDVAGPPRRENWKYEEVISAVENREKVGFVPDLAHFNPVTLELFAVRRGQQLRVSRLGQGPESASRLSVLDFVVGKTGFQGLSYITLYNHEVYNELERLNWPLLQTWELPDNSRVLLWRNPTHSP